MRNAFTQALWQIPSVRSFLRCIVDDLVNRRTTLVLLPDGIAPLQVDENLQYELRRLDLRARHVNLSTLPPDRSPLPALVEALAVKWNSARVPHTIANLMKSAALPEIISLEGLDQLPAPRRDAWTDFIVQWARASQSVADQGRAPTALCSVLPAGIVIDRIPEEDIYLALHWWWGFPSVLELRLIYRASCAPGEWDTRARWQEYQLAGIAGNDLDLIDHLLDSSNLDVAGLTRKLEMFAAERGWTQGSLEQWGANVHASASQSRARSGLAPPVDFRKLWACGALATTQEYGPELHSAALALLGRTQDLRHRLWRGQAEMILPLIERVRLAICDYLTSNYGADWPSRSKPPNIPEEWEGAQSNPLAAEWGHLDWLLGNCSDLRREKNLSNLVSRSRWIRNEVAHCKPISYCDFEEFLHEAERIIPGTIL